MAKLLFTPSSTIEANIFQYRLDGSSYNAKWNAETGAYEFILNSDSIDELEEEITQSLAFDIDGLFEVQLNYQH